MIVLLKLVLQQCEEPVLLLRVDFLLFRKRRETHENDIILADEGGS